MLPAGMNSDAGIYRKFDHWQKVFIVLDSNDFPALRILSSASLSFHVSGRFHALPLLQALH